MSALAIFTCRPNSHPFQERHVSLHEPVKVGRSVARARPAPNNAVFDCKVLSRNHALIWYENGKFFLQDTKSSNGTFVNNTRLSKGSEESPPREIFSSDIVQFGVDVMENSRRVTHGCIIATVTLFHQDGTEAKPVYSGGSPYNTMVTSSPVRTQELYQLSQYLQEALHREQMLENKLAALQRLVHATQESSESGWQAMVDEDRLLSRLEVLENQLVITSKNQSEDALRQELVALQEDKSKYENTAKESLRKVLEEKLEAVRKLSELERSFSNTEDECGNLKEMCENSQKELQSLAEKHEEQLVEIQKLQETLTEAEQKHEEEIKATDQEKEDIERKLEEMSNKEAELAAKVESLQANNDFTGEQLTQMRARMEDLKNQINDSSDSSTKETIEEVAENLQDEQNEMKSDKLDGSVELEELLLKEKLKETQEQIGQYRTQLSESETRLQESKEKVEQLQSQMEQAQMEVVIYITKVAALEEKLRLSDMHLNQVMENTMSDLKIQLEESQKQSGQSTELSSHLKGEVSVLETELKNYKQRVEVLQHSNSDTDDEKEAKIESCQKEIVRLANLLEHLNAKNKRQEEDAEKCQRDLEAAQVQANQSKQEAESLKAQLDTAQHEAEDKSSTVEDLKDQLNKAEATTKEVKEQILDLRDRLIEEQEQKQKNHEEAEKLRKLLEEEKNRHVASLANLESVKTELEDARMLAQKSKEAAEDLKVQLSKVQNELEKVLASKDHEVTRASENQGKVHTNLNAKEEYSEEIQSLKGELLAVQIELHSITEEKENQAIQNKAELLKAKQNLENEIAAKEKEVETNTKLHDDIERQQEKHQAQISITEELLDQSQTEAALLKAQLSDVEKQLQERESEKKKEVTSARQEMEKQVAKNQVEFNGLRSECASLRKRIQNLESDMKTTKKDNAKLSTDYNRLQESYKELEALKERLESQEESWKLNLTDAQKEAECTKNQLTEAYAETATWKDRCAQCKEEITVVRRDLDEMGEEYTVLADRSRTISICSMVPLVALLFALLLAFYPTLSALTATADQERTEI